MWGLQIATFRIGKWQIGKVWKVQIWQSWSGLVNVIFFFIKTDLFSCFTHLQLLSPPCPLFANIWLPTQMKSYTQTELGERSSVGKLDCNLSNNCLDLSHVQSSNLIWMRRFLQETLKGHVKRRTKFPLILRSNIRTSFSSTTCFVHGSSTVPFVKLSIMIYSLSRPVPVFFN